MLQALRLSLCVLSLFFFATPVFTADANQGSLNSSMESMSESDPVVAAIISEEESVQPGHPFWVGIHLTIEKDWHTYWKNPGDAGMAPVITWNLPDGLRVTSVQWPTPIKFSLDSAVGFGYEHEVTLLVQITPEASLSVPSAEINADVRWVVCSDTTCLPGDTSLKLTLPVNSAQPVISAQQKDAFVKARGEIPKKNEFLQAQRKDNLIELSFKDSESTQRKILSANFYPEEKQTINYKVAPVLLAPSKDSNTTYTIILKEETPITNLKGVLVFATDHGSEAYDVNLSLPKTSSVNEDDVGMVMSPSVGEESLPKLSPAPMDKSFEFEGGLALALAFAFIGGLLLNLMPCVLPVISFKVLSFVKLAKENRKLILQHGMSFSFGVLLSFWVLAGLLLILQAYGRSVGWGFQLQEPLFVAVLASLLLVFSLSLFGLFEVGTSVMGAAGQMQSPKAKRSEMFGSFLSGVLATAVATPCTGPFLGSAVGFAFTLPAPQTLLIFTSLGLGMSAPYLALSAFPALLRFIPKPGPWMIVFKELMGFLMLATVIWLVWVFSAQTNSFAVTLLLAAFFLMSFAGWIYGKWGTPLKTKLTRTIGLIVAAAIFGVASYTVVFVLLLGRINRWRSPQVLKSSKRLLLIPGKNFLRKGLLN